MKTSFSIVLLFLLAYTAIDTSSQAQMKSVVTSVETHLPNLLRLLGASFLLAWSFYRTRNSLPQFRDFLFLTMLSVCSYLVILFIKDSLTLSLGLVGALSIIRFRTPIKDPVHLIQIFFAMLMGIGLASSHMSLTLIGLAFIILAFEVYRLTDYYAKPIGDNPGYISVVSRSKSIDLEKVHRTLSSDFPLNILRIDDFSSESRISYQIKPGEPIDPFAVRKSLQEYGQDLQVHYSSNTSSDL